MALTEAKGSLEEQARAERFRLKLFEKKERRAAELAAMTSEQREFADEDGNPMPGVSVISGPVGKTATIRIVPANSLTTTTNIVSVKFSIEKELNSENMMVDDKIIMGGESGITYTIEQTKNDF